MLKTTQVRRSTGAKLVSLVVGVKFPKCVNTLLPTNAGFSAAVIAPLFSKVSCFFLSFISYCNVSKSMPNQRTANSGGKYECVHVNCILVCVPVYFRPLYSPLSFLFPHQSGSLKYGNGTRVLLLMLPRPVFDAVACSASLPVPVWSVYALCANYRLAATTTTANFNSPSAGRLFLFFFFFHFLPSSSLAVFTLVFVVFGCRCSL